MEAIFKACVQGALENEGLELDVMQYRSLCISALCYKDRLEFYIKHPNDAKVYIQPDNLIYTKNKQHLLDTGSFKDIDFKSFLRKCNNALEGLEKQIQREKEHQEKTQQEIKGLEVLLTKDEQYPKLEYLQTLKEDHKEILKEIGRCSADKNYKSAFVAKSMQATHTESTTPSNARDAQENTKEDLKKTDKQEDKQIEQRGHTPYLEEIKAMNAFLIEEEMRLRTELETEEPLYEAWMQKALELKEAYWEHWREHNSIEFRINRAEEGTEEISAQELEHLKQECTRLGQEEDEYKRAFEEHVMFANLLSDEQKLKDDYPRGDYLKGLRSDHETILAEIKRTQTDPTHISTFRPEHSDHASWHATFYDCSVEERNKITQISNQARQRQKAYKQERNNLLLGYEQNQLTQAETEKLAKLMFEIAHPKLFETCNAPFRRGGAMKELLKNSKRCIEEGKQALDNLEKGLERSSPKNKKGKGRR